MNSKDLRNFIESNKPLLDELENLAIKYSLEADNMEVCKSLQDIFESLSSESGRFQLGSLDAVFDIYAQMFEQLAKGDFNLSFENKDIVSSGMEVIYKTLLEEDDPEFIGSALTEVEESLMLILSGESLELPPALLEKNIMEKSSPDNTASEIRRNFIIETTESLEEAKENLIEINVNSRDKIESLKIIFHNINGNSKYLGYMRTSAVSEMLEKLFRYLQTAEISPDSLLNDTASAAINIIYSLLEDINSTSREETDIDTTINTLHSLYESLQKEDYEVPIEFAQTINEPSSEEKSTPLELEYLDEFFVEATDHVSDIESKLLQIEDVPDADSINSILNSFHSIKGSSQYIGLDKIGILSHKAESILDLVRKNNIKVTSDVVEVLLKTIDMIRILMKEVEADKRELLDISEVELWLDKVTGGKSLEFHVSSKMDSERDKVIEEIVDKSSPPGDFHMPDFDKKPTEKTEEDVEIADLNLLREEFKDNHAHLVKYLIHLNKNPEDKNTRDLLRNLIHSMKGASAYLPSPLITSLCESVEKLLKSAFDKNVTLSGNLFKTLKASFDEFLAVATDDVLIKSDADSDVLIRPLLSITENILAKVPDPLNDDDFIPYEIIDDSSDIPDFVPPPQPTPDAPLETSFEKDILKVKGFGKKFLNNVKKAGFDSAEKIKSSTLDQLLEIKGINIEKAQNLLNLFDGGEVIKPTISSPPVPSLAVEVVPALPQVAPLVPPPVKKKEAEVSSELLQPLSPDKDSDTVTEKIIDDDYDRELIGIFLDTANEYLTDCTKAIAEIDGLGGFEPVVVESLKSTLNNLYSSSNYMEYEALCVKISNTLERIDSLVVQKNIGIFVIEIGKNIEAISNILPAREVYSMEEEKAKTPYPEAISSDLDSTTGEDEELISIFVGAAEKNMNEIKNVLKLIRDKKISPEIMSNLYSNLNNLQLSANFLGFENLFDIIEDAKGISNQLHDEEENLDLTRFNRLEDYLSQIKREVHSIKKGSLDDLTPEFPKRPETEEIITPPSKIAKKKKIPVIKDKEFLKKPKQEQEKRPDHETVLADSEDILSEAPHIPDFGDLAPKTLRVDIERINDLLNMASEMVINRAVFTKLQKDYSRFYDYLSESRRLSRSDLQTLRNLVSSLDQNVNVLGRSTNLLQDGVMKIRMVPINLLFRKLPRIIRDLSRKTGKKVTIEFTGDETELDRTVIEKINDPLIHIIRNAVDHGIEAPDVRRKLNKPPVGIVTCSSYYEGDMVIIEVHDDGTGIDVDKLKERVIESKILDVAELEKLSDSDLLEIIFFPGFTTSDKVTATSGRGVGMDVVKDNINKLGGTVTLSSEKDTGTTVKLRIPLTLAIIKTLLVRVQTYSYAIPVANITETIKIVSSDINTVEDKEVINFRDQVIPLLRIANIFTFPKTQAFETVQLATFGREEDSDFHSALSDATVLGDKSSLAENELFIIVLHVGDSLMGLHVDSLVGEQDIVIENLDDPLIRTQGISGAAILGDGTISLILDVNELTRLSVERERTKTKLASSVILDQIIQDGNIGNGIERK